MAGRIGFKAEDERNRIPYEKYLGTCIVITTMHGGSYAGKYVGMSPDGNMILNPHQNALYDEFGFRRIVLGEDAEINPGIIGEIFPTTEKSLEGYCRHSNVAEARDEQKRVRTFLEDGREILKQMGLLQKIKREDNRPRFPKIFQLL